MVCCPIQKDGVTLILKSKQQTIRTCGNSSEAKLQDPTAENTLKVLVL